MRTIRSLGLILALLSAYLARPAHAQLQYPPAPGAGGVGTGGTYVLQSSLLVRDTVGQLATIFAVQSNDGSASYLSVNNSAVNLASTNINGALQVDSIGQLGGGTISLWTAGSQAVNVGSATQTWTFSGPSTFSMGSKAITLTSTAATARAGLRNANTRNVIRAGSVAVPDCAGATLNLTVTQFLDAGVATCGTVQTINFPTWQGASGIVQGLPGTPAIGDFVEFQVVASAANALTVGAGTGGTLGGSATVPANTDKIYRCRLTNVTASSEAATCY